MITIEPVQRALVPRDDAAAQALSAPNYDEFQSDVEIWNMLQARPDCVLRVTMAHCDVEAPAMIEKGDSEESLQRAAVNMRQLQADARMREVHDLLWVYEIASGRRSRQRQIGLGGMARTDEIRTKRTPRGAIIRNEGVRESKARGRARLIERTGAIIGTVNNAVDDESGALESALQAIADSSRPDLSTTDEAGNVHRIWLVTDHERIARLRALIADQPHAYVADGNHRSAAAAMLGYAYFPAVFFPARMLHIDPYNRLVKGPVEASSDQPAGLSIAQLARAFEVDTVEDGPLQPERTHEIGLYDGVVWYRLRPRTGSYDAGDAARDIDADIVQRNLFADVLGIADARDERLVFVGGNRDAAWLQAEVDAGRALLAVTLPGVTMDQFIRVCAQGKLMPPKSTWFDPKLRSGLVVAMLDG